MERKRALTDPLIPVISHTTKERKVTPHRKAIALVVTALHRAGIKSINYDHVTVAVPKSRVPLWIEGHRADISFALNDDLIFIDVIAIPRELIELKDLENGHSDTF